VNVPWYVQHFDLNYLEHLKSIPAEQTRREVDFICDQLALPENASVLDLCCGPGRHAIELARRGYRVTGQDLSQAYVDEARKEAGRAGVEVNWICADMREIPLEHKYNACYIWYSSYGYLETDEDDLRVLARICQVLSPGGRLIVDVMSQAFLIRNFTPFSWQPFSDGSVLLERLHYNMLSGHNCLEVTAIRPDGERIAANIRIRMYTFSEIARMLAVAGLRPVDACGDIDGSEYTISSPRMIVLAEK
jgi:SAM-dependent methyltransferase